MADLNQLAKKIFEECKADGEPVTMEEALEMAKMEANAKEDRQYTTTEANNKARKPRERKIDNEKLSILQNVKDVVAEMGGTNIILKTETEVSFSYGENEYSLKLIKHRPPKK